MATMTIIWWRDIPAQVTARDGRRSSKIVLHPRFQVAIDKAASRAGKRSYDTYIEECRKVTRVARSSIARWPPKSIGSRPNTTSIDWRC